MPQLTEHDTAALFDRLMYRFQLSRDFGRDRRKLHAAAWSATWHAVRKNLARRPTCPKLKTYWHFYDCRYEKTSRTCAEPDHIATCPVPTHRLRNGHLNQLAYSLYLFIRDVADGDLVGWIDDRLDQANDPDRTRTGLEQARNALIDPLRNVYGVSDKVLTMALSGILIGAAAARPRWLEVGVALIAVDTLVHNFLHRTGILDPVQGRPPLWRWLLPVRRLRRYHSGGCPPDRCPAVQPRLPEGLSAVRAARDLAVLQPTRARHLQRQPASMTGIGAKTGTAGCTAFATEFA